MGYRTIVDLGNDAMSAFQSDPRAFGLAILEGIERANESHREESVPIGSYCNYINVHPSRHADDETVFVFSGNRLVNINPYNQDFEQLAASMPNVAEKYLKTGRHILALAASKLKKWNKQRNAS